MSPSTFALLVAFASYTLAFRLPPRLHTAGTAKRIEMQVVMNHIGTTQATQGYAHVHLDIQLSDIMGHCQNTMQAVKLLRASAIRHNNLTGPLSDRFFLSIQRTEAQLERTLSSIDNIVTLSTSHTGLVKKRQVAIVLGIIGTIAGLFSLATVTSLAIQTANLQSKQRFLIHTLEDHEKRISTNSRDVNLLKQGLNDAFRSIDLLEANQEFLYVAQHVAELALDCQWMAQMATDIIQTALAKQLHTQAVNSNELVSIMRAVEAKAHKHGYTLATTAPADIFQLETSILAVGTEIHIICHIPLARPSEIMDLYHYRSFPVVIDNSKLVMHIQAQTDVIAIYRDIKLTGFMEMSSQTLSTCRHQGERFFCDNNNVVKKNGQGSCIYALFARNMTAVQQHCNVIIKPAVDTIIQTGTQTFLSLAAEPTTVALTCAGTSGFTKLPNTGTTRFNITEGCVAETPSHRFAPSLDIQSEVHNILDYALEIPMQQLLRGLNASKLEESVQRLADIGKPAPSIHDIDKELADFTASNASGTLIHKITTLFIAIIIIGCTCAFIVFIVRRTRRKNNGKSNQETLGKRETSSSIVNNVTFSAPPHIANPPSFCKEKLANTLRAIQQ